MKMKPLKEWKIEWQDINALLTVINVILLVTCHFSYGVVLAGISTCRSIIHFHKINAVITNIAVLILNAYFLLV